MEALREALIEGEESGRATPFDFGRVHRTQEILLIGMNRLYVIAGGAVRPGKHLGLYRLALGREIDKPRLTAAEHPGGVAIVLGEGRMVSRSAEEVRAGYRKVTVGSHVMFKG